MSIRRVVDLGYMKVAEWEHPQELSRDWDAHYHAYAEGFNWYRYINKGDLTIDIGAHTGDTALVLGYLSENVIAFEPNPDVFPVLQYNAEINPQMNIRPINYAITAEATRTCELYDHSVNNCNMGLKPIGEPKFLVPGVNLEWWLLHNGIPFEDVKFIKIDCEGYDIDIFNSIPNILACKPVVFMEWYAGIDDEHFFTSINLAGYAARHPQTLNPVIEKIPDVLCLPTGVV